MKMIPKIKSIKGLAIFTIILLIKDITSVTLRNSCLYNGVTYTQTGIVKDCDDSTVDRKSTRLFSRLMLPEEKRTGGALCHYKGQTYTSDTVISSYYDELSSMCYGSYCTSSGTVVLWAELNCDRPEMRSFLERKSNSIMRSNRGPPKLIDSMLTKYIILKRLEFIPK